MGFNSAFKGLKELH